MTIVTAVLCQKCGLRPGDKTWVGEGGFLVWTHGMSAQWCERCVVEAQLAYARRSAERIPQLEQRLRELDGAVENFPGVSVVPSSSSVFRQGGRNKGARRR